MNKQSRPASDRDTGARRRPLLPAAMTATIFVGVILSVTRGDPKPEIGPKPREVAPRRNQPMFGVDNSRNQINTVDRNIPTTWKTDAPMQNIKWAVAMGSRSYGAPTIAGGKVFVGTNNERPRNPRDRQPNPLPTEPHEPLDKSVLMCFDEDTGKFLWQAVHDKLESGMVNDWPREGLPTMPTVQGNRLYYVSNRCEVLCADTEGFLDGKNDGMQGEKYQTKTDADIVWRLDMMKELKVFPHNMSLCAPLLVGDLLFVVTSNGVDENHVNLPSPNAPSFIAVNKKTGKVVWQSNLPGKNVMHGQWSNATYADVAGVKQVIFPGGDGWLYAFDPPTGKLIWKFDCNPKGAKYELGGTGDKSDFIATSVVYEGRLYIAT
jgi:outer membrane protein assembly factor BamB